MKCTHLENCGWGFCVTWSAIWLFHRGMKQRTARAPSGQSSNASSDQRSETGPVPLLFLSAVRLTSTLLRWGGWSEFLVTPCCCLWTVGGGRGRDLLKCETEIFKQSQSGRGDGMFMVGLRRVIPLLLMSRHVTRFSGPELTPDKHIALPVLTIQRTGQWHEARCVARGACTATATAAAACLCCRRAPPEGCWAHCGGNCCHADFCLAHH